MCNDIFHSIQNINFISTYFYKSLHRKHTSKNVDLIVHEMFSTNYKSFCKPLIIFFITPVGCVLCLFLVLSREYLVYIFFLFLNIINLSIHTIPDHISIVYHLSLAYSLSHCPSFQVKGQGYGSFNNFSFLGPIWLTTTLIKYLWERVCNDLQLNFLSKDVDVKVLFELFLRTPHLPIFD